RQPPRKWNEDRQSQASGDQLEDHEFRKPPKRDRNVARLEDVPLVRVAYMLERVVRRVRIRPEAADRNRDHGQKHRQPQQYPRQVPLHHLHPLLITAKEVHVGLTPRRSPIPSFCLTPVPTDDRARTTNVISRASVSK